jgi:hypothetical protein
MFRDVSTAWLSDLLCVLCVHVSASIVVREQLGDLSGDVTHQLLFGIVECLDLCAYEFSLDGSFNRFSNSEIILFM